VQAAAFHILIKSVFVGERNLNDKYCILGCDAAYIYEFIRLSNYNQFFPILSFTAVE
jgi:hypothetical protein